MGRAWLAKTATTDRTKKGKKMIHITRNQNGSYSVSAEVRDNQTPFSWYETQTYYGYAKKELKRLYREHLAQNGMKIQK